jgi:hypothetical protein
LSKAFKYTPRRSSKIFAVNIFNRDSSAEKIILH